MCKLNGLTLFLHFYTLGNLKRRFHRVKIIKNVKSIVGIVKKVKKSKKCKKNVKVKRYCISYSYIRYFLHNILLTTIS
jgi:hypothetical protein